MDRIAIVVIAYNRTVPLLRLLDSLTNAYYPEELDVPLIISVDKSFNTTVADIAKDYVWEHGDKYVRLHEENLGLRQHVLMCGDIANEFDGVILLEDDLYVSPSFYMYTLAAFARTRMVQKIGGISLYNHRLNVHAREPFEAIDDGYDNYYMQLASSWGQAFSTEQWRAFRSWYEEHKDEPVAADNVPVNVSSWSEKSWLKYCIKYLIETGKYFLYPRVSYATNFGDEGEHMSADGGGNDLQVPLAGLRRFGQIDLHFSDIDESMAIYDAYFENMCLEYRLPTVVRGQVSIDIYGMRQSSGYKRYVLSSRPLPYRMLESYGRRLRPVDANVICKIEGLDFFLYDTQKAGKAPAVNDVSKYLYNYRALKAKEMMKILMYRVKLKTPFGKPRKKPARGIPTGSRRIKTLNENSVNENVNAEGIENTDISDETESGMTVTDSTEQTPAGQEYTEQISAEQGYPGQEYAEQTPVGQRYPEQGSAELQFAEQNAAGDVSSDAGNLQPEGTDVPGSGEDAADVAKTSAGQPEDLAGNSSGDGSGSVSSASDRRELHILSGE